MMCSLGSDDKLIWHWWLFHQVTGSIQIFLKDARNMDEVGGAGAVQEYGHPPNDGSEWWRVPVDRLIEKGQVSWHTCLHMPACIHAWSSQPLSDIQY